MRSAPFARSLGVIAAAVFLLNGATVRSQATSSREWRGLTAPAAPDDVSPAEPSPAAPLAPEKPLRIAQYPLENDPYEGPPVGAQAPAYSDTRGAPASSSPYLSTEPEEEPWIDWESTQISAAYLHDTANGLGWSDVVGKSTIKFPHAPFVWVSPQAGAHFISNSGRPNVPSSVYDVSLEVVFGLPLSEKWIVQGGISPGIFSDFQGAGGDEFRLPFRGLMFYKWSETLTIGGGFLYLDRPDVNTLPLVGLSYIPSDDFRVEIWFPRAKISKRYWAIENVERWVYAAAEFGGGSWAIQRDSGLSDNFAYRDYRMLFGVEQKCPGGLGWFVEGGLIFGRQMTFARTDTETSLDSTAAMQAGMRF